MFKGSVYGMKFTVVLVGFPIGALYHDVCKFFNDGPTIEDGWPVEDCFSLCMAHILALAHCWVSVFDIFL